MGYLALLYCTGLRLAEVVAATTDDLTWASLPHGRRARIEGWWLAVHGKGSQRRRVPMAPTVMATLCRYLARRGFAADLGARQLPRGVTLLGHALDLSDVRPGPDAMSRRPAALLPARWPASSRPSSRNAPTSCARPIRAAPSGWLRPAPTGCGTPTSAMRSPVARRWRSCSRTPDMPRWPPRPSTCTPRTPGAWQPSSGCGWTPSGILPAGCQARSHATDAKGCRCLTVRTPPQQSTSGGDRHFAGVTKKQGKRSA